MIDCGSELRIDELERHAIDLSESGEIVSSPSVVAFRLPMRAEGKAPKLLTTWNCWWAQADADCSKVHIIEAVREDGSDGNRSFNLQLDSPQA